MGGGVSQTFRGLHLRTHPDADVVASKVELIHADEINFLDVNTGAAVSISSGLDRLVGDITASGAGGLDAGSEGASRWYEIYVIRKSSDGTLNLLLHRAKDYLLDANWTTDDQDTGLRNVSSNTKRAQTFLCGTAGQVSFVDVKLDKIASPTGNMWVSIYATSGGAPTGAALASSDKIDVSLISTSAQQVRFVFRNPTSLSASTTYALVYEGDFTIDGTNYIGIRAQATGGYSSGSSYDYNGSTWTSGSKDFWFRVYVTENDTAVTMPSGYDQKCLVGHVYNDSGSNFVPFAQRDRIVTFRSHTGHIVVSAGSVTIPTLVDASASSPPLAVLARLVIVPSGAGNVYIASDGQVPDSSWRSFGQAMGFSASGQRSDTPLAVLCETQGFYYAVETMASATIYILGYMW